MRRAAHKSRPKVAAWTVWRRADTPAEGWAGWVPHGVLAAGWTRAAVLRALHREFGPNTELRVGDRPGLPPGVASGFPGARERRRQRGRRLLDERNNSGPRPAQLAEGADM